MNQISSKKSSLETQDNNRDRLQFNRSWLRVWAMTSDPQVVQHILLDNSQNYRKSLMTRLLLEPPLGKHALFTSEGERWRLQRRLAAPAFSVKNVEGFAPLMIAEADRLLKKWDRISQKDRTINVLSEMSDVTLRIIMRAMFSRENDERFHTEIADVVRKFARVRIGMMDVLGMPTWVPRISNLRLRSSRKLLDDTAGEIIFERRQSGEQKRDLLGLLMSAVDETTGSALTVSQLKDEVRSYFIAGFETTATALTWVFYALHVHPEVEAKLHREIDTVLNGRMPELSDLENLPYCLQVVQETMRFYPVVPIISRQAISRDEINGTKIPENSVVEIDIQQIHRAPDLWDQPEAFLPQRFAPDNNTGRHRFAYLPFGGGPRICIGAKFSLQEAHLILVSVAQRWRLRAPDDYVAQPVGRIVLQPRDGLPVKLEYR